MLYVETCAIYTVVQNFGLQIEFLTAPDHASCLILTTGHKITILINLVTDTPHLYKPETNGDCRTSLTCRLAVANLGHTTLYYSSKIIQFKITKPIPRARYSVPLPTSNTFSVWTWYLPFRLVSQEAFNIVFFFCLKYYVCCSSILWS